MVTLYILVGSLVGLILAAGLATLIGTRIPEAHDCEVEGRFSCSPQTVWDTISNVTTHAQWRKLIKNVEVEQAGQCFRLSYVANPVDTRLQLEQVEEPCGMVWVGQDIDGPMTTTWTLKLTAEDQHCRLHIHEQSKINHPWYRFVFKYITGYDKMLKDFLLDLEHKLTKEP